MTLLVMSLSAAPSHAQAPERLTIANAGEPGLASLVTPARGDCFDVYDASEARGEPEPCGPGSWPGPGGDWGEPLTAAGGDRLVLRSDAPFDGAELTVTTNLPLGFRAPGGAPVLNETLAGPLEGEAVDDDRRTFAVELPRLDARPGDQLAVAVVLRSEDVERHFAFAIRTPGAAAAPAAAPPPAAKPSVVRPPDVGGRVAQRRDKLVVRFFAHLPGPVRIAAHGRVTRWVRPKVGRWQRATLRVSPDTILSHVTVHLTQRTAAGTLQRTASITVAR